MAEKTIHLKRTSLYASGGQPREHDPGGVL